MDLIVLPSRLKLGNEHGFPRQSAAAWLGNPVPGSELVAIPSSTERCETRLRPLLLSCGQTSIVTSRRSTARVSHANRVWNKLYARIALTSLPFEKQRDCSLDLAFAP